MPWERVFDIGVRNNVIDKYSCSIHQGKIGFLTLSLAIVRCRVLHVGYFTHLLTDWCGKLKNLVILKLEPLDIDMFEHISLLWNYLREQFDLWTPDFLNWTCTIFFPSSYNFFWHSSNWTFGRNAIICQWNFGEGCQTFEGNGEIQIKHH